MRAVTLTRFLLALAATYLILAAGLLVSFLWPRTVHVSFASQNCFVNPLVLPGLDSVQPGKTYTAVPINTFALFGHTLYSHTTCLVPIAAPRAGAADRITRAPMGFAPLRQTVRTVTGRPPSVSYQVPLAKPLSTKGPLVLDLSTTDRIFDYQLTGNGRTAPCAKNGASLACDTFQLQLEQSSTYSLSLQRTFRDKPAGTLFTQSTTTVGAVLLVSSSIAPGGTVFDIPTALTLTFNKPIKSYTGAQLSTVAADGSRQKVASTITAKDTTLTFTFAKPLARATAFEAAVTAITAPDSGHLPAPFVLAFTTSGGPKVQSTSVGSYKVSTSDNISITFDTTVSGSQNLGDFIQLQINGQPVAAALSRSGTKVILNPAASLPACTRFTLTVLDGIQNEAGVAGGSAWSYNSRTICQTTFSIGTSVKGRAITAYRFGTGASLIVYDGTLHGNERSAEYTLTSWIDYLERNYDSIPAGRTIVVIPVVNPDGAANSNRVNAHNVDLNRNFDTSNWKQSVTMPGGSVNSNGGGNYPLSEPESAALAGYIATYKPRLVLDYHATAGIVEPNDAGDSNALAKTYDSKSNLNYSPTSQNASVFTYDTTGSFEDWANEQHNIPVLLVELWTYSSNEFSKNQAAMWYMATI